MKYFGIESEGKLRLSRYASTSALPTASSELQGALAYVIDVASLYICNGSTWGMVSGAGEANTASNLGSGSGLYASKSGVDLRFKSLVQGTGIVLTPGTDSITIDASGGGGGEANTASNLPGGDASLFESKVGVDLRFKNLKNGTNINMTSDSTSVTINSTGGSGGVTFYEFDLNTATSTFTFSPAGWATGTYDGASNITINHTQNKLLGMLSMIKSSSDPVGLGYPVVPPTSSPISAKSWMVSGSWNRFTISNASIGTNYHFICYLTTVGI
jgi:hypothetical protein